MDQTKTKPKVLFVHPTGNPFASNAAIALDNASMLHAIVTCFNYSRDGRLARLVQKLPRVASKKLQWELLRRSWISVDRVPVYSYPHREIIRIFFQKFLLSHLEFNPQRLTDWVYQSLDNIVAKKHLFKAPIGAVYCYEDAAASTFSAAKQKGRIVCLYDLPIMYYATSRRILQKEAQLFPALASNLSAINEPTQKPLWIKFKMRQ